MFELTIESVFSAAHALAVAGVRETLHGHDWHVTATIAGESLDEDGLLCDFHTAKDALDQVTGEFNNRNLNETPPFCDDDREPVNPTAEQVARHIHTELSGRLNDSLAPNARITSVRVTESPGCSATYRAG